MKSIKGISYVIIRVSIQVGYEESRVGLKFLPSLSGTLTDKIKGKKLRVLGKFLKINR